MVRTATISTQLAFALSLLGWLMADSAAAQNSVEPDDTLGRERSIVIRNTNLRGVESDRIEGGAIRGRNLFHSFEQFNVQEGRGVYFSNPDGIQTIINRVTGRELSDIQGRLGVLGNANLVLMNPNGILFGRNASLDLQGSFLATTSSALEFADQGLFSAVDPVTPALLTVDPSAFLFNQLSPGAIINRSVAPTGVRIAGFEQRGLLVPDGQSLLLIGGDISLENGRLNAPGGRIELGGLAEPGQIGLERQGDVFQLNFPNAPLADLSLNNNSLVSVLGTGGGDIVVNAHTFTAATGGRLLGGTTGNTDAGNIVINATDLRFRGINSANIGSGIYQEIFASGSGGNITVNARSIDIAAGAGIKNNVAPQASGRGGNIQLTATDSIALSGSSAQDQTRSTLTTNTFGLGNGGNIRIDTGQLTVTRGAAISASAQEGSRGRGGNLLINASDSVSIRGFLLSDASGLLRSVLESGNIIINTEELKVQNGGNISARFLNDTQVDGGNLLVRADLIQLDRQSSIQASSTGANPGSITLNTEQLILRTGSQIFADAFGQGQAGNIQIQSADAVLLTGDSTITTGSNDREFRSSLAPLLEQGGKISIRTSNLTILDNAEVNARTRGSGNSGSIDIQASDQLRLVNGSISTIVDGGENGNGGNITVTGGDIRLDGNSDIRTSVQQGRGSGGNVTINANTLIAYDDSDIIAAAFPAGRGGNIDFGDTIAFFENYSPDAQNSDPALLDNSRADINATGAEPGIISISDTSFIQNSLSNLPNNAIDTDRLLVNSCIARTESGGTFWVTGSGGLPESPDNPMASTYPTGEVRSIPFGTESPNDSWQRDAIVEPQGVYRLPDGRLVMSRECEQSG